MRIEDLCPGCPFSYIDAACIVYNGSYLTAIDVANLTTLDEVLLKISNTFTALSGSGVPNMVPRFIGQFYIDLSTLNVYIGMSNVAPLWAFFSQASTTTTTTSTTV